MGCGQPASPVAGGCLSGGLPRAPHAPVRLLGARTPHRNVLSRKHERWPHALLRTSYIEDLLMTPARATREPSCVRDIEACEQRFSRRKPWSERVGVPGWACRPSAQRLRRVLFSGLFIYFICFFFFFFLGGGGGGWWFGPFRV